MTTQSETCGCCPTCGSRSIVRSKVDRMHRSESHQCSACGARLVTTLGLRRSLLIGASGFVFFVLAIWALSSTNALSLLPTLWQWVALLGLVAVTYFACMFQIRRGINYELWIPVNAY